MNRNEKVILAIAASAHFFTHFAMLAFPAMVMPMSRDLGLPVSQVVDLSFWMYFLYGVLAMGWGWISDKWGHKTAMGTGLLIAGAGLILAGSVPNLLILPFSFALVGVGCSSYHPAGTALVSQGIRERGRALGLIGIYGNIGIALVPFLVGFFNLLIGWRGGLIVVGVFAIILGTASYFARYTVQKGVDEMKTQPLDERTAKRLITIFIFSLMFGGLLFRSFTLTLPSFLEMRLGDVGAWLADKVGVESSKGLAEGGSALSTLAANSVATFIYVIAILGQWFGGRAADRYSLKHVYPLFFILSAPFLLGVILLQNWLMVPAAGMFVFFILGMQPVENSLVAYLTPAKWRSMGYGIKFTFVFGVGSLAVKLVSIIEENFGMEGVMQTNMIYIAGVVLFSAVLLLASRGIAIRHHHA